MPTVTQHNITQQFFFMRTPAKYDSNVLTYLELYNKGIDISEEHLGLRCAMAKVRTDIVDMRKVMGFRALMKRYPDKIIREGIWRMMGNPFCNGRTSMRSRPAQLNWLIDPNHPERFVDLLEGTL